MRSTDRTIRSTRPRWQHAVALGAVAALALGACGGDDDDDDAAGGGDGGDTPAYCQTYADAQRAIGAAMEGEGDPSAALGALQDDAPEELASDAETFVTELMAAMGGPEDDEAPAGDDEAPAGEEEGPPPIPGPAYFSANEALGDWVVDNCDFNVLRVTTRDYEFSGIPDDVDAGTTLVKITNEGGEWHEVLAMSIVEGEERSVEELLALPEEEVGEIAQPVGFVFTPPGTSAYTVMEFGTGRHAALCFIPVGTTEESLEDGGMGGDGPPHAMEGMYDEFQVS